MGSITRRSLLRSAGIGAAFESLKPLVSADDPEAAKEIEAHFAKVDADLKPYRRGDGFVSYTTLTSADTRRLAQSIDALAEKLSQVPAEIVG
ncbi:MAG TPA: imelysin family protein [Solirubrobacterales bacterium]|jgi:iron uptake system component EfeO|nr:imelysin family protein [Solirubrobacterales bacterium]